MLTNFLRKKININLPNFHDQVFLNLCFIILQESNKTVFRDGYEISGVEGCFPYSTWSCTRDMRYITKHDMETTLKLYSKHNIPVFYILDNPEITKQDLNDTFSNLILDLAHKEGNGVFVKSRILYDYISEKYPKFKIIKIADVDDFKQKNIAIIDKYNNKLQKKDIKHKENAYITLNPMCPPQCKHYDEHRTYVAKEQVNYYSVSDVYVCPLKRDFNFFDMKNNSNFISAEKINDYIKSGFRNFRISFPSLERSVDINYGVFDTIESYVYYLIKPENQEEVRHLILKKFAGNKNG